MTESTSSQSLSAVAPLPFGFCAQSDLAAGTSMLPVGAKIADLETPRTPPIPLPSSPPPLLHRFALPDTSTTTSALALASAPAPLPQDRQDRSPQRSFPKLSLTRSSHSSHVPSSPSSHSPSPDVPTNTISFGTQPPAGGPGYPDELSEQTVVHRNSSLNSAQFEVVASLSRIAGMSRNFPRLSLKLEVEAEDLLEDKEVVTALSDQISFGGVEDLLRGVRLYKVVKGGAAIFKNSQGSAETYELSERVPRLKYFLSHNWSVSRWDKLWALSFKLNFHAAFLLGIFLCLLIAVLGTFGTLPTLPADDVPDLEFQGFLARIVVMPLVFLVFIFGREPCAIFGYLGPYVFLDKVCIHQTNKRMQRDAIDRLGAFLRASDRMLLFYSSDYLRRLWTIYEIANFLTLRRMEHVDIIPVVFSRVVAIMIPLCYVHHSITICTIFAHDYVGRSFRLSVRYLTVAVGAYAYLRISRRWQCHKRKMLKILAAFEVQTCTCAVDADRPIIYEKIAALMRASRKVGRNASLEEALAAFNQEVQCRMPQAFGSFLGASSLRYTHYLFFGFCLVLPQTADNLAGCAVDRTMPQAVAGAAHEIIWFFSLWPFLIRLTEALVGRFPNFRGWSEKVWVVMVAFFGCFPAIGFHTVLTAWTDRAATDPQQLKVFVVFAAVTSLLTLLVCLVCAHLQLPRRDRSEVPPRPSQQL